MDIYVIVVGLLFIVAISDLIVGVSNDAVNFLNSAIGSKVASYGVILAIASIGVLAGSITSDGMMEVARKGIFHPDMFTFTDLLWLFLGVMLADIILLDTFNTLGLPTSTTVSIVFELLGGAVAVATIKLINSGNGFSSLYEYINTAKALLIIFGILLSVFISFTSGAIVQYLTRLLFTFNFVKRMKYFGAFFTALSLAAIIYFLLIKGMKNTSFLDADQKEWVKANSLLMSLYFFGGAFVILQLVYSFTKVNILKIAVLGGTFALAMAFAGNDLVNFIGVPLAGFESYKAYVAAGENPGMMMDVLSGKVHTPLFMLLIAGMVMVMTMWLSKKARTVTQTTLNLSSQGQNYEQFGSSMFARTLVRGAVNASNSIKSILPDVVLVAMEKRFDNSKSVITSKSGESFDLVRAMVNLLVAAILISIATQLKLPLSTTYVTFMVAMGTSLADGAWGRESAVYRVTGVITVIGGWFFTALSAFIICAVLATLLHITDGWAMIALIPLTITIVIFSKKYYSKKEAEKVDAINVIETPADVNLEEKCKSNVISTIAQLSELYANIIEGTTNENRVLLRKSSKSIKEMLTLLNGVKENLNNTLGEMHHISLEDSHNYIQVVEYLKEAMNNANSLNAPCFNHVDNQHKGFKDIQKNELTTLREMVLNFYSEMNSIIESNRLDEVSKLNSIYDDVNKQIQLFRKNQVKRIKTEVSKTRNSILFFTILHETKILLYNSVNSLKSYTDFINKR